MAPTKITSNVIADDAIDSEHYTDGSIDTAHIADDQVTLAKMAGITRGSILIGNSSGDALEGLAIGSNDYVLTSDGTDIAWEAASSFDADAAQTFNDSGADVDFRVESNNDANILTIDGGEDRVGIGTASPATKLDVDGEIKSDNIIRMENNIAILGFKMESSNSAFQMDNQWIDSFNDLDGISASDSTNEALGSGYVSGKATADAHTKVLLSFNSSNNSTTITNDGHSTGFTGDWNLEGGAVIKTAESKFGGSSLYLDGTDDYMYADDDTEFLVAAGYDMTLEFWYLQHTQSVPTGTMGIAGYGHESTGTYQTIGYNIGINSSDKARYTTSSPNNETDGSSGQSSLWNSGSPVWNHIALVRSGSTSASDTDKKMRIFVNGTFSFESGASSGALNGNGSNSSGDSWGFYVGAYLYPGYLSNPMNYAHCYIDELRLSVSVTNGGGARYSAGAQTNFTAPTTPYLPANDLTLVSNTITAASEPDKADVVILYKNEVGTATLNTDLILYLSKDAGSNWSSAITLSVLEDHGISGYKVVGARGIDISGLTGTTSLRYKVTTHNQGVNKETQLHGISLAWK